MKEIDIVLVGGGQSALATAYFLKRLNLNFVILDAGKEAGGAWVHGWESLHLFSPASWSSLPGRLMPSVGNEYPSRQQVINYISDYEKRYEFKIERPVLVESVLREENFFLIKTNKGDWKAKIVISATGTWSNPFIPKYKGQELFQGKKIHSANYNSPEVYRGKKVLIIGGGNSGAQILAEVSKVSKTTWVTQEEPIFLPDNVDGRILFERATERWKASLEGRTIEIPKGGLGDIVMVSSVSEARELGVLSSKRPFVEFTKNGVIWQDGIHEEFDEVIWCTGFRASLGHLSSLNIIEPDGKIQTNGTHSIKEPRLWLVGYGDWVGYASATLIGVARTAKATAEEIKKILS
jgi:putative flavoprotein involved in K+ transport